MLSDEQPAYVREEESSLRVVRIRVGVRELVVNSVVPHPFVDVVLGRENIIGISWINRNASDSRDENLAVILTLDLL